MKDLIIDSVIGKLIFGGYVMASAFTAVLLQNGLYIHLLYWGLGGQILATLIDLKGMAERDQLKKLSPNKIFGTLLEWIIGPTIALVVCSYIQGVDAFIFKYAFAAALIGAFWEIAWAKLKVRFNKWMDKYIVEDEPSTGVQTLDGGDGPSTPPVKPPKP